MKRIVYILWLALAGFGCTHDPFEGAATTSESTVSLSFEIPASELVVTYSAADDAARENAIARMDVFAFDQAGNIISGSEGHLVLTNINLVGGKGRAMVPVTIPPGSTSVQRQFGIVANAPDAAAMDNIATLSDLRAAEFTQGATLRTTHFVMSDISALNTIDDAAPTINMSLRRAVSRVDVLLDEAITNFEITSVQLINVRDKGFVFGKNTAPDDLSSPIAVPATSAFVSYPKVDASKDELKRNFSAQLYCPENYNADKDNPAHSSSVIVGGIYNGSTYYYRVDLHDNNRDAQIRRNYLYRVNIRRVNGAGNPNAADAVNDPPQNLDYTVSEWDYSQHSDVIFDGKNYLGVSEKTHSMPKAAGSGSIKVVSSYADTDWRAESCDENGNSVAAPSWITLTKSGSQVDFAVAANTAADAAPRTTYVRVFVPSNPRLVLIASIQQYHTDQSLIRFEPQIISASWNATTQVFKTTATLLAPDITWTVESLNLLDDKTKNWCRLSGNVGVGSSNTTAAAGESFELLFDIDEMNAALLARTALINIRVRDKSGFTEMHAVTLTQSGISNALSVSRLYIGKTAEIDVEKISINTTGAWSASFMSGDGSTATAGCSWLSFTDASYSALADPAKASGMGSGNIYVKFDACPANTVRNGYIVVTNGGQQQWIRVHQGDYRTVKINGYEMLDRNLGATATLTNHLQTYISSASVPTLGYYYQWGRRPDGYEVRSPGSPTYNYVAPSTSAGRVIRQPLYGDPAWGKYVSMGTVSSNPLTGNWLYPDPSLTPADQREIGLLWDSRGVASNSEPDTNLTSMRTDYDPCPDGWRVPTAREMSAIIKYGAKPLKPINGDGVDSYHGRFITTDNGGEVFFPTSSNRYVSSSNAVFVVDPVFSTAPMLTGWYWTSSYSETGSPYALRIIRSDIPELLYTQTRKGLTPVVYPPAAATATPENLAGGHAMNIRCVRDRKITEELSVDVRRKTVNMDAQAITAKLTTTNLIGTWSASSDASWLRVSPSAGSSDAELDISVTKNPSPDVRQGEIRITTSSGAVASIVVVQLDESGILVSKLNGNVKRWWRNCNAGATTGAFSALDDDNLGYFYGWGVQIPLRWTGPSANPSFNTSPFAWNLATGQATNTNYPYPVKNVINDPCPAGWRVPSYWELSDSYTGSKMANVSRNGWANNRQFTAADGKIYYFPALGYRNPAVSSQGPYGFYWSSLSSTAGTAYYLNWPTTSAATMASPTNKSYGMPVRCVQDLSDSFD